MSTPTIKFYPNTDKTTSDSRETPLYFRVILQGKKKEGKLPIYLNNNELAKWIINYRDPDSDLNLQLSTYRQRFKHFVTLYPNVTLSKLTDLRNFIIQKEERVEPITEASIIPTVKEFIESFYINSIEPVRDKSKGTKKNYRKAYNHFSRFVDYIGHPNLPFSEVKKNLGIQFKEYLVSDFSHLGKTAVSKETASGLIKKVMTAFDSAISEEYIKLNPFRGLKIKIEHRKKQKLSIFELKKLLDLDLGKTPSLNKTRWWFLSLCFSGAAFIDMLNLKPSNLKKGIQNSQELNYKRQKTGSQSKQLICWVLELVFQHFRSYSECQVKERLVPKISLKELNLNLTCS
jgi:hypothetical protein